jgi:hypothetical protein
MDLLLDIAIDASRGKDASQKASGLHWELLSETFPTRGIAREIWVRQLAVS